MLVLFQSMLYLKVFKETFPRISPQMNVQSSGNLQPLTRIDLHVRRLPLLEYVSNRKGDLQRAGLAIHQKWSKLVNLTRPISLTRAQFSALI